jgi:hypothetical protein
MTVGMTDPTGGMTDPTGETESGMSMTTNMTMTSMPPDTETTDNPTTDQPTTDEPTTTGPPATGANFRFSSMDVRDPHFFADTLVGCVDVTDMAPLNMAGVNDRFNEAINMDTDADGFLDLSLMLLFRGDGLDQTDGGGGDMDFANGQCEPAGGDCDLRPASELQPTMYTSQAAGVCHEADPTHLSGEGYTPVPGVTMGPCFHAGPADVTIVTTSFELPLTGAEIAATFQGDPATSFMSGTLRGFLTTAAAEATPLPMDLQMSTGAMNVAGLLPGGAMSCAAHDDTDDGGSGWWFYVDFTALPAAWIGP